MTEIIPAIMPDSFDDLTEKASLVMHAVSLVQIDIMDGKFVKSRSWPYFANDQHSFDMLLEESDGLPHWDTLDYEIDLMVNNPENVIEDWIAIGASRLIVHIESTKKMNEIVETMNNRFGTIQRNATSGALENKRDVELGIALNPDTPISDIVEYLEDIEFVQFMGINRIGFQGEQFDERVVDNIREFHNAHPEVIIAVDGGVSYDHAPLLAEIGVKRLVSGSTIFGNDNPAEAIKEFRRILS